jgi:hypothetical protein
MSGGHSYTCCDASGTSGLPCSLFLYAALALGASVTLCIQCWHTNHQTASGESARLENMPAVCVCSVMLRFRRALQPGQVAVIALCRVSHAHRLYCTGCTSGWPMDASAQGCKTLTARVCTHAAMCSLHVRATCGLYLQLLALDAFGRKITCT